MTSDLVAKLTQLGLSDSEATTYLALVAGATSARELMKATGQKRPTIYYALGCLERRGLIAKNGRAAGAQFTLASSEHLAAIARDRVKEAQEAAADIDAALPMLTPASKAADGTPAVAFFEGKEAVSRVIMDMLYTKEKKIDVVAPTDNFFWQVGRSFVEKFVSERKVRGITTRSLWERPVAESVMKQYYDGLSEVRLVPPVMRGAFQTSVFIYDNQVLYVSSLKSCYAVLITSKEHCGTMRAWFNGLWETSKAAPKKR